MEPALLRRPHDRLGFASTHWTTIRLCAGSDDASHAARAKLCQDYWYPLYAYIKRQGNDHHHAEDLTQDFFGYILKKPWFVRADQTKGRFRSFLLASVDNFLRDEFSRKHARKRGGDYQHIPYDLRHAEACHAEREGADTKPVQDYEVEWAAATVAAALKQLEDEWIELGRQSYHQCLKKYLAKLGDFALYKAEAEELNTSLANVKVAVHRLRQRYGEILKERVAKTVATPEDVEEEMRHLRTVLSVG